MDHFLYHEYVYEEGVYEVVEVTFKSNYLSTYIIWEKGGFVSLGIGKTRNKPKILEESTKQ